MSAAITAAVVGVAGTAYNQNQAKKAQKKAQEDAMSAQSGYGDAGTASANATQQSWADITRANDLSRENQDWAYQKNLDNAQKMQEMNQGNISWSNDLNKQNQLWGNEQNQANQLWGQGINQAALDKQLGQNRINQTNAMGNSLTYDANGNQISTLNAGDQATLDALRGKEGSMVGGLGGGFDVNGDVMNAYRGVNQPLLDQQRGKENARLAAMGLGTGSGSAWGTAQDALNRNQVNSDQNAILQGFNADQQLRSSNRSDLASMEGLRSGINSGLTMPDYAKAGFAGVNAPSINAPNAGTYTSNVAGFSGPAVQAPKNMTYEAWDAQNKMNQQNYQNAQDTNAMNARGNQNIWGSVAGALGNKDVQAGLGKGWDAVSDWWNTPSTVPGASGGSTGTGYDLGSGLGTTGVNNNLGYDLGSGLGNNTMSGFYTNPWGGT